MEVWAGSYFSFYKDAKGMTYAFGLNNYGQLGIGSRKDTYLPTPLKSQLNVSGTCEL